jgi:DMSO/TMAO reductase YedYZ molybdopterin-dependent catalytic subunit
MFAFVIFIIFHVALVFITGFERNMNHIVMGTDDTRAIGWQLGLLGIAVVIAVNIAAWWLAWHRPRTVQHAAKLIVAPTMNLLLNHGEPKANFAPADISPYFWCNGKVPTSGEWLALAANNFKDYRLKIFGLVDHPVELSLDDLRAMPKNTQITLHHCIQGWSGIAAWTGVPVAELIKRASPRANAGAVVFRSFGEGSEGGNFYDTLSMENACHPLTLVAYDMNYQPLNRYHGAPLRLRVENQLGYKMVKWIQSIELVETTTSVGQGEGGYNEDYEYFGELANI